MKVGFDLRELAIVEGILYNPHRHMMVRYKYDLAEKSMVYESYPKANDLDEIESQIYDIAIKKETELMAMVSLALKGVIENEID